jgi:hypothetical protein
MYSIQSSVLEVDGYVTVIKTRSHGRCVTQTCPVHGDHDRIENDTDSARNQCHLVYYTHAHMGVWNESAVPRGIANTKRNTYMVSVLSNVSKFTICVCMCAYIPIDLSVHTSMRVV